MVWLAERRLVAHNPSLARQALNETRRMDVLVRPEPGLLLDRLHSCKHVHGESRLTPLSTG
jgi:hypothetical protein